MARNNPLKDQLLKKIEDRTAVIGIVGLGYVGLPLGLRFAEVGFRVLGFDIDREKVRMLNAGRSYIKHIGDDRVRAGRRNRFEATAKFDRASTADALILCVPTPLDEHREPDMSFVFNTTDSLVPHLRKGQLFSLESTTYPGTTDEDLKPRIEKRGFKIGRDIFLVFSPEREDPGNPNFNTRTIPKVCGGMTPACQEVGVALYGTAVDRVVPVSSTRAAEMTKLLENIHRAVNIGLVNEMKIVCDRMGIDVYEIIRAASTKPFGFVPYYPGPGLGGHCIPIDPFYLTWKAREYGVHTKFIELAGEINSSMPHYVMDKVIDGLNGQRKSLKGARVLVLGIAYKKDIDDPRESPSIEIMELLEERGAVVSYSDPFFPSFPKMREHSFDLKHTPLTPAAVRRADVVLVATAHTGVDYRMVRRHAKLIVDTRGVYSGGPRVVRA